MTAWRMSKKKESTVFYQDLKRYILYVFSVLLILQVKT
jgi:hypothetical protein